MEGYQPSGEIGSQIKHLRNAMSAHSTTQASSKMMNKRRRQI